MEKTIQKEDSHICTHTLTHTCSCTYTHTPHTHTGMHTRKAQKVSLHPTLFSITRQRRGCSSTRGSICSFIIFSVHLGDRLKEQVFLLNLVLYCFIPSINISLSTSKAINDVWCPGLWFSRMPNLKRVTNGYSFSSTRHILDSQGVWGVQKCT